MVKIYLSPSNQLVNTYCMGGTNEKVQMEALASKCKSNAYTAEESRI